MSNPKISPPSTCSVTPSSMVRATKPVGSTGNNGAVNAKSQILGNTRQYTPDGIHTIVDPSATPLTPLLLLLISACSANQFSCALSSAACTPVVSSVSPS